MGFSFHAQVFNSLRYFLLLFFVLLIFADLTFIFCKNPISDIFVVLLSCFDWEIVAERFVVELGTNRVLF